MPDQQRTDTYTTPKTIFESMVEAANRHDREAMVLHFASDYRSMLPFSPERNFTDLEGVRKNWRFFFSTMPDFRVEILSEAVEGNTVWSELYFHGTRADGTKVMIQAVNIMEIQAEKITWENYMRGQFRNHPGIRRSGDAASKQSGASAHDGV